MRIAVMTDGGNAPELNYISGPLTINEITTTSVSVDFNITNMLLQPTSYQITYQRLLDDGITNDGLSTTITTTSTSNTNSNSCNLNQI